MLIKEITSSTKQILNSLGLNQQTVNATNSLTTRYHKISSLLSAGSLARSEGTVKQYYLIKYTAENALDEFDSYVSTFVHQVNQVYRFSGDVSLKDEIKSTNLYQKLLRNEFKKVFS